MSRLASAIGTVVVALAIAAPASAADPVQLRITSVDASAFPTVGMVATVTDAAGRPIDGVSATDLVLTEDGRPQRASLVRRGEQQPVALALALDVSGSMAGKPLNDAKAALAGFVGSLTAADSAALITFNASVSVAQPLTTNKAALDAAIGGAAAGGNTAVFDATNAAIDLLANADPKAHRAIVLLTDGVDNSSRATLAAVTERIRGQGYALYIVALGTTIDNEVLRSLAGASAGGGLYIAPTSDQLPSIYTVLAREIKVQYLLSYVSDAIRAPAGAPVTVTLQLIQAGAVRGTAQVTFNVPVGRGIAAPVVPPTNVHIPSTALAPEDDGAARDPLFVGLLATATTLCLLLWVSTLLEQQSLWVLERTRLARYVGLGAIEPGAVPRRSFWVRAARPALLRLAGPFGRWVPQRMLEGTRQSLAQSGGMLDMTPVEFIGLRIGLALAFAIIAGLIGSLYEAASPTLVALSALIGALFGYLIPGLWLSRAVRGRRAKILRALPSALDMLALSASAGMTFDGAIGQVAQRWRGPLSDEFRRLLLEFNMGRDRRAALRGLAERTGVPEVGRFANAVVQADALGTPISRVLQEQAVEMRTRRRQRAEEAARKAPVKMLFPMVGLIFPALFVVILGPAVPRFMNLFQQFH